MRTFPHGLFARLGSPPDGGPGDDQLLAAFVASRDEVAFQQIVRRHGPMVHAVCRRVLRNDADADDAFQATFLVFVRKAASVRPGNLLGNWLHGVAANVARKGRELNARRRAKELAAVQARPEREPAEANADLRVVIDEELSRLPAEFRAAVVACDLEGRTRREAAGQLGWSEGTVASRLARARSLLADRLTRRGVAVPAAGLAVAVAPPAATAVPAALFAGHAPAIETLAHEAMRAMIASKLKSVGVAVLAVAGLAAAGAGVVFACGGYGSKPAPPVSAAKSPPDRSVETMIDDGVIAAWAKPMSGEVGASDKPGGENAGVAKSARFVLSNPARDITVVSDRHETLVEFFRRQRVMVAGVTGKDFTAALAATKPTDRLFVDYASRNEDTPLNAAYGSYVRLAPVRPEVADIVADGSVLVLVADPADKDVWHVAGFTTRSSVGFFASKERKGRDDFAPADLHFVDKK